MNGSADDAIERTKLREVAAIFHSQEALEAAAEALLLAGFDRADIDRLADLNEVRKRLGPVYVAHEELADVAQAPRRPVIMREDITTTFGVVVGVLAALGGLVAALVVVAFGGGTPQRPSVARCWRPSRPAVSGLCSRSASLGRRDQERWSRSWRRAGSSFGSVSDRRMVRTRRRKFCFNLAGERSACTRSKSRSIRKKFP
jgi:hypothetical protein